ncbi:hypothetical protein D3C81_1923070 [compost metagenome]
MWRIDQCPVQRTALHGFANFFGGMALQAIIDVPLIEYGKIPHQKQPRHIGRLQAIDQCVDGQYLLDRSEHNGAFNLIATEWQPRCIQ